MCKVATRSCGSGDAACDSCVGKVLSWHRDGVHIRNRFLHSMLVAKSVFLSTKRAVCLVCTAETGLQRRPLVDEFDQLGAPMDVHFAPCTTSGPVELPPAELGNLSAIAQVG